MEWSQVDAAERLGIALSGYKLIEKRGATRLQVMAMKYLEFSSHLYGLRDFLNSFETFD